MEEVSLGGIYVDGRLNLVKLANAKARRQIASIHVQCSLCQSRMGSSTLVAGLPGSQDASISWLKLHFLGLIFRDNLSSHLIVLSSETPVFSPWMGTY